MKKITTYIKAIVIAISFLYLEFCLFSMHVYAAEETGVNKAKNGVVSVQFYLKNAGYYITDGLDYIEKIDDFGVNGEGLFSSGSGFFVGGENEKPMYVVTNCHVIDDYLSMNAGNPFVYFIDEEDEDLYNVLYAKNCELRIYYDDYDYDTASVECYGDTEGIDLAVLKIRQSTYKRHALPIKIPEENMTATEVWTLGFPGIADNELTSASHYGLKDITVHKGVINKFVESETGVKRLQIDAVVQHGNSGGPLVTENGTVIGVNTNVVESEFGEKEYYAINSSELLSFLNENNIPYVRMQNDNGLNENNIPSENDTPYERTQNDNDHSAYGVVVWGFIAIIIIAFLVTVVVIIFKREEKRMIPEKAVPAQMHMVKKTFIRSMAAQHKGKVVEVGNTPILIGRDYVNCNLIFKKL